MWKIGNVCIKNRVVLAPMAGVSNPAYMRICEEMGIGYAITELISAEAIVRGNKKTLDMLKGYDKVSIPVALQLFGSNKEVMAKAAKIVCDLHLFDIIDINMGCPVPKVANRSLSGSYLLKDPDKCFEIVKTVRENIDIPVTVKIRSGWDSDSINAVQVAKKCEEAGASSITVHARTRSQGYSGKADWNVIKEVKESVNIPVIGNGDVKSPFDALKMIELTKCDAVMIGRAALGNPWLLKNIVNYLDGDESFVEPTYEDRILMAKKHLNYLLDIKPEEVSIKEMRMHISYYLKGLPLSKEIKEKIFKVTLKKDFERILDDYLEKLKSL